MNCWLEFIVFDLEELKVTFVLAGVVAIFSCYISHCNLSMVHAFYISKMLHKNEFSG